MHMDNTTMPIDERRVLPKEHRGTFKFGIPLSELKSRVDELITQFGEDARFSPTGYENCGGYSISYDELESKEEHEKRVALLMKRRARVIAAKRAQLERLKRELGEE